MTTIIKSHLFKALNDAIDIRIEDLQEYCLENEDDETAQADLEELVKGKTEIQKALRYYREMQTRLFVMPPDLFENKIIDAYTCSVCGYFSMDDTTGCDKNCGVFCGFHGCECEGSKTNPDWLEKQNAG